MNGGILAERTESGIGSPSESLVDGLRRKKLRLESQLKDTNEALTALENNEEMTKVLELILKTSRF